MFEVIQNVIWEFAVNRYPIRLKTSAKFTPFLTVEIDITNQTATLPTIIHQVRIHFGSKFLNRAFALVPHGHVHLGPKSRGIWFLSWAPGDLAIVVRTVSKQPPKTNDEAMNPGIESPMQLFDAIRMGDARASWVEVDFNEYREREFLRGKMKGIFTVVGAELDRHAKVEGPEPPHPA